ICRREAGSGKREAGSGKREAGSGKREAGSGKRECNGVVRLVKFPTRGHTFSQPEVMMRLFKFVLIGVALAACSSPTAPAKIPDLVKRLVPKAVCMPIGGTFDSRAPAFIIEYKAGVDPVAKTAELANRFDFTPLHVYTAVGGFAAELSDNALVGVSCDASVAFIEHDGIGSIASQ
ncbi:MAG: hypothetical protein ACREMS_13240, partial [Gemmatimonadaceae bacterium]